MPLSKLSLNQEPRETLWLIIKWVKLQQLFLGKHFICSPTLQSNFLHSICCLELFCSLSCSQHHYSAARAEIFNCLFLLNFFCFKRALSRRSQSNCLQSRNFYSSQNIRERFYRHEFPQPISSFVFTYTFFLLLLAIESQLESMRILNVLMMLPMCYRRHKIKSLYIFCCCCKIRFMKNILVRALF